MRHFYLSLTEACNLRCPWCFWKEQQRPAEDAFDLDAIAGAMAERLSDEPACGVVFYGGEPTLRMERMQAVMEEIPRRLPDHDWWFAVQTNGTHLDRLAPLADRLWFLSVSINQEILKSLDRQGLEELGRHLPIIARMTYVGEPLAPQLEGVLPFVSHVYWQLVNGASRPFELEQYERELESMMALATEQRDPIYVPLDYAWTRLQAPPTTREPDWFPCGVGDDLVYVTPTGGVCVCDELSLDHIEADLGAARRELEEICEDCPILHACRGRCPAVLVKHGRGAFLDYCRFSRLLFRKVAESGYPGRQVDAIALQTEVMH